MVKTTLVRSSLLGIKKKDPKKAENKELAKALAELEKAKAKEESATTETKKAKAKANVLKLEAEIEKLKKSN